MRIVALILFFFAAAAEGAVFCFVFLFLPPPPSPNLKLLFKSPNLQADYGFMIIPEQIKKKNYQMMC